MPQLPTPAEIAAVCRAQPARLVGLVQQFVAEHGNSSKRQLDLVASHNRLSPLALSMLSSSTADRIMSGRRGAREHAGAQFIDAIDEVVVQASRQLFGAEGVEYRAPSGAIANGLAIIALASPGDNVMAFPARFGGHTSYREAGYGGARGLRFTDMPCRDDGSIELDATRELAHETRPRLLVVGTAWMLEPVPLAQLRSIADEVGALVLYDGAHILGLAAGAQFQEPLREGAHVLSGSTQKTLGGPIGGLVLSSSVEIGERIQRATSGLISNYHNNRIAALAVTLAETLEFGRDFASSIVRNAQRLALELRERGLPIVGSTPALTQSHLTLLDTTRLARGMESFARLEAAGVLTTKVPLPGTYPERRALRLGTPAITRSGMQPEDMTRIADLVARALLRDEAPESVAVESAKLASMFPDVKYCFETSVEA